MYNYELSHSTLRTLEPANIAELLKSDLFTASEVRILITGYSDATELLNSEHSEGIGTAIDSITHNLRMLLDLKATEMNTKYPSIIPWKPPVIRMEFEKSILDERGRLIFGPGYPLPTVWIHRGHGWYDYDAKYKEGGSYHVVPANIPDGITEACLEYARRAHRVLGCRGVSRTDFRWDDTKGLSGLYLLETNTQPGMTPTSLSPEQAAKQGISFGAFCRWMVEDASCLR